MATTNISIIVPALDEAALLADALEALQELRKRGHEVLVVDGGSRDGSVTIARRLADRVLMSGPGRALQMNAGAESARHEILLFLHTYSRLPNNADAMISAALEAPDKVWGFFKLQHATSPVLQLVVNWSSALIGVGTGAQAIFVRRTWFEKVGGYDSSTEEDIALSRKLRRHSRPQRISAAVSTLTLARPVP
jgi:glycosyltransferase involved in cell wall biosynthesis